MASPSVTNTFVDAETADAVKVNENYNDLIEGITDGTKDLQIANLNATGLTVAGPVTLGGSNLRVATYSVLVSTGAGNSFLITADSWFDDTKILFALACIYQPSSGRCYTLTEDFFQASRIRFYGNLIFGVIGNGTITVHPGQDIISVTVFMKV